VNDYYKYDKDSQGSVATNMGCDELFNDHIIANFVQSASVKNFWKQANVRKLK